MPYQQAINRHNKALFVFLLEQSSAMRDKLPGCGDRKMDVLAATMNGWLNNMCVRATGDEALPRDWMDVVVLGYRTDEKLYPIIEPALGGDLEGKEMCSLTEIGANPLRIEARMQEYYDDEVGEMLERTLKVPIWVEPKAQGATPMCSALYRVYEIVEKWIDEHPASFPPVVIQIANGENDEDGNPIEYAESIKNLETEDGNVLLCVCDLSCSEVGTIMFPNRESSLPAEYARGLFRMSSVLPWELRGSAIGAGCDFDGNTRGMAYGADANALSRFVRAFTPEFGVRQVRLR